MSSADTIAQLLLEEGRAIGQGAQNTAAIQARAIEAAANARAQAAQQNGQIWGQTLASLGQLPMQVMQQQREQKTRDLQNQILQGQLQGQQSARLGAQQANQIVASLPRNADGTFDTPGILQQWADAGVPPNVQGDFAKSIDGINGIVKSFNIDKLNHSAKLADFLLNQHKPDEPISSDAVQLGLAVARDIGLATDQDQAQFDKAIQSGADMRTLLTGIRNASEQFKTAPYTLNPGDVRFGTNNQPIASNPKPTEPKTEAQIALEAAGGDPNRALDLLHATQQTPAVGSFEDYVDRTYGKNPTPDQILAARKAYGQADDRPRVDVKVGDAALDDVKETIKGMKDGTLPPILPGRATKEYNALLAEAHRQGFDLAAAATDWAATQKHIATLNGSQQLRLNQAINQLPELLDSIDALASKWKAGRFPVLNKATLALAKNGAFGKDAASIANQLEAQIADVTGDLGAVYMGGNSPTDHALELASKALNANWDEKVLKDMTALARKNVQTRLNSIRNTGVAGASATNPYGPASAQMNQQAQDTSAAPDLSGLQPNKARQFTTGPFAGQTWTMENGQPKRVK